MKKHISLCFSLKMKGDVKGCNSPPFQGGVDAKRTGWCLPRLAVGEKGGVIYLPRG